MACGGGSDHSGVELTVDGKGLLLDSEITAQKVGEFFQAVQDGIEIHCSNLVLSNEPDLPFACEKEVMNLNAELDKVVAELGQAGKDIPSPLSDLLKRRGREEGRYIEDSELDCLVSYYEDLGRALPSDVSKLVGQREEYLDRNLVELKDFARRYHLQGRTVPPKIAALLARRGVSVETGDKLCKPRELEIVDLAGTLDDLVERHLTTLQIPPGALIELFKRRLGRGEFWIEAVKLTYLKLHFLANGGGLPEPVSVLLEQRLRCKEGARLPLVPPSAYQPWGLGWLQIPVIAGRYEHCGFPVPNSISEQLNQLTSDPIDGRDALASFLRGVSLGKNGANFEAKKEVDDRPRVDTLLMKAADTGDLEKIKRVIHNGKKRNGIKQDFKAIDVKGRTAWHRLQEFSRDVLDVVDIMDGKDHLRMMRIKEFSKLIYPGDELRDGYDLGGGGKIPCMFSPLHCSSLGIVAVF